MSWKGRDSYLQEKLNKWKGLALIFKRKLPISKFFVVLLTNEQIGRIYTEPTNFPCLREHHGFTINICQLKSFIAIILLKGYTELQW